MTILQIHYALAVEEHKNFSRAADSLFVSQPALSRQIKQLEQELGYHIFARSTHEVTLTELGQEFCEQARTLAEAWDRFEEQVSGRPQRLYRHLRIGLGSRVYSNGLFDAIVRFFDGHPDLEVTFVTEAGRDFLSDLKDGQLDLALDMLPPQPLVSAAGSFVHVPLVRERQCVLMAKEDPRSGMETIALRDIHGCTIITGLEDSIEERMLKFICQKHGVTLNRFYRSDGIETNMRLLRNGKGVTLGPASFAAYYGVAAVPIEPELSTSLDFICLEKNADRPETAALRKFLVKLCAGRH